MKFKLTAKIYDKRGRILSVGENSYWKTHPFQGSLSKQHGNGEQIYLHAEIAALVRLKDWSKAYKIRVERYSANGSPALAKPCKICRAALIKAGIEVIEHT
jgi:deoxycytidylate deaminase